MKSEKKILNFIEEAGLLKRVKRSGWWVLGIKNPESVAEHSFRCAVIGYVLAKMEKADPYKILVLTLLNDIHEARIGDLHKMSQPYFQYEKAEDKAFTDQVRQLPYNIGKELIALHKDYRKQNSKETRIARDADILECLIQAKEYTEHGYKEAVKFMKKAPSKLKSPSAKKLWSLARRSDLNKWWESLSVFNR